MDKEYIEETSNGNVFQRLKKHIMDLAYGEGKDDDFDAIVDLYEDIESIRSMMQDLDSDRDYYRRESAKKTIKINSLEKQIGELQKEKEDLKRLGEELLKRLARWEL